MTRAFGYVIAGAGAAGCALAAYAAGNGFHFGEPKFDRGVCRPVTTGHDAG